MICEVAWPRVLLVPENEPRRDLIVSRRQRRDVPIPRRRHRGIGAACTLVCALAAGCVPMAPAPPVREVHDVPTATAARPDASLFSRNWSWTDEKGESVTFAHWAGKPLIVTAIFTRC